MGVMPNWITTLFEVVGIIMVFVGLMLWSPAVALTVVGFLLIAAGVLAQ
jgi:hypothetical protein